MWLFIYRIFRRNFVRSEVSGEGDACLRILYQEPQRGIFPSLAQNRGLAELRLLGIAIHTHKALVDPLMVGID